MHTTPWLPFEKGSWREAPERSSSRQLQNRKSFGEFVPYRVGADDSVGPINVANSP